LSAAWKERFVYGVLHNAGTRPFMKRFYVSMGGCCKRTGGCKKQTDMKRGDASNSSCGIKCSSKTNGSAPCDDQSFSWVPTLFAANSKGSSSFAYARNTGGISGLATNPANQHLTISCPSMTSFYRPKCRRPRRKKKNQQQALEGQLCAGKIDRSSIFSRSRL
jgi:hypothetical protein